MYSCSISYFFIYSTQTYYFCGNNWIKKFNCTKHRPKILIKSLCLTVENIQFSMFTPLIITVFFWLINFSDVIRLYSRVKNINLLEHRCAGNIQETLLGDFLEISKQIIHLNFIKFWRNVSWVLLVYSGSWIDGSLDIMS